MITIADWARDVTNSQQLSLTRPIRVTGIRDKHLGPRWEKARIHVLAEPAAEWSVAVGLTDSQKAKMEQDDWIRHALLGILDVLITRPPLPLTKLRVRLVDVEWDDIHSSRNAFRMAGRDAGEKIIEEIGKSLSVSLE